MLLRRQGELQVEVGTCFPPGSGGVWRSVITRRGGDAQGATPSLVGRPYPGPAASGDENIRSMAVWWPPWQAAWESPALFIEAPGASGWGVFPASHQANTWPDQRDMDHKGPAGTGPPLGPSLCTNEAVVKGLV